jgi:hypothetical protein
MECKWVTIKAMVKDWFNELAADFHIANTQRLITQYDRCMNLHGDYVEELFKVSTNDEKYFF